MAMAEGGKEQNQTDDSWESWIGGWVQTAKDKSSTALEMVKKDLTEFSCTMQKETEKVVEKTSSQLKESLKSENTAQATGMLKAGLTSFLDNVTKALVIPPDEDDNYIPMKHDGNPYDKRKARLNAIQLEEETYTQPPRGPPEQFAMWQESFDMDLFKGEISELLVSTVEVRSLYTRLVPSEVSHAEFWQRYFFRVHQLDLDEARKKSLMLRAEQSKGEVMGWDDDDEDDWSAGEEDDGNLSDWEKLGKPPQAQPPKPSISPTKSDIPKSEDSSSSNESKSPDNTHSPKTTSAQCEVKTQNMSTDSESTSDLVDGEKLNNVSPAGAVSSIQNKDEEKANQSCHNDSQGSSQILSNELWSLHIPNDTASAAQDESQQHSSADQHPDSLTTKVPFAMTTSAAAAGGDMTSSEVKIEAPADGACGAADTQSPDDGLVITQDTSVSTSSEQTAQRNLEKPASSDPSNQTELHNVVSKQDTEATEEKKNDEPSSQSKSSENLAQSTEHEKENISKNSSAEAMRMKVKGDMVVVGDTGSPSSDESADLLKELGADWDEEFDDIDVTEDDLKAAEDIARRLGEKVGEDGDDDDDWENWE